ncbi:MAG TPA: DUF1800 domain-containing protein [Terriglobales bacterium]|nr:DUF1800 domain-containing protein [Terriglobales bacterium]
MRFERRRIAFLLVILTLATASGVLAFSKNKEKNNSANVHVDEQERALHALNRLTFGPRPGDVQRVSSMGADKWIELQLHPDKIDDGALQARLAPFRTLRMDTKELAENFPPPQLIKAVAEGKQRMPSDPAKRAVYEAQLEKYQEKQERKQEGVNNANPDTGSSGDNAAKKSGLSDDEMASRREAKLYADLKAQELLDLPPDQRMKEILKMSPDEQRELARSKDREDLMEGLSPQQKETLMAINNPQQVVVNELMQAKLLRAVYSERQLDEVMTDFWFNHFNIFIGKGADRYLLTGYERDVIRPHALSKFEDLLVATAESPAMLFYLDNWLSVGPDSDSALGIPKRVPRRPGYYRRRFPNNFPKERPPRQAKNKERRGLNENYGRELMELHTLGVNGGYTQRDVTEVARVLTGWTIEQPKKGGGFKFEERMHEPGTKVVLGHKIKEHGEKQGLEVLHILAHHPSTAKFISTKLAMRFVSDNPPPALVDRMAQTFLKKDGDIRDVLRTMFHSPEFWAPDAYRAKVKTPLEFVVSAVRATGGDVQDAMPLIRTLNTMGMPLYGMQPPTGYSMKADTWVNSSALLGRMNFALALSNGKLKGIGVEPDHILGSAPSDAAGTLAALENVLLAGDVSEQTHETILKQLDDPQISGRRLDDPERPPNIAVIAGLILGSPEFQRR